MNRSAIIVHGGCGKVREDSLCARKEGVKQAAERGWEILREGGSAVDAVEAAVVILEDLPLFNAGCGSVLNRDGRVETDAAIMNGVTRAAGAVACVTEFPNPILLARRVMDASPHVLLVGSGAEFFAKNQGIVQCDPSDLVVEHRREEWEREHGTVGAVACDQAGCLAAATSTGGCFNKLPGRVGDSAIIGSGTYADSRVVVSCTGYGENIMRMTLARLVAFLHQHSDDAQNAAVQALQQVDAELGGDLGLIVVDYHGKPAFAKNTTNMPVCAISDSLLILQC